MTKTMKMVAAFAAAGALAAFAQPALCAPRVAAVAVFINGGVQVNPTPPPALSLP